MSLYTVKKTGVGHYSIVKQEEIGWTNNIEQAELIAKVMNAYSEDDAEKAVVAREVSSDTLLKAWNGPLLSSVSEP